MLLSLLSDHVILNDLFIIIFNLMLSSSLFCVQKMFDYFENYPQNNNLHTLRWLRTIYRLFTYYIALRNSIYRVDGDSVMSAQFSWFNLSNDPININLRSKWNAWRCWLHHKNNLVIFFAQLQTTSVISSSHRNI